MASGKQVKRVAGRVMASVMAKKVETVSVFAFCFPVIS